MPEKVQAQDGSIISDTQYHPDFSAASGPDSDVTLVSRDRVRFRISANVLKSASSVFETTLSLPQPSGTSTNENIIDSLDEDSQTIEGLLRIITAKEIPLDSLNTLDAIEPLLLAADKWDMRGPSSYMRLLLLRIPDLAAHPIRLYWLGCCLGWADVAAMASKQSINRDLYHEDQQSWLRRLNSADLLRLMTLHRSRLEKAKTLLEKQFGPSGFHECHWKKSDYLTNTPEFRHFTLTVLEEMDRTAAGASLSEEKLRDMMEASRLTTTPGCPACGYRPTDDFDLAIAEVEEHLLALPQTI